MADYLGYERAFKNFGIKYSIEPGAFNRGHGDLAEVRFIVIHHTAGGNDAGDIRVVRDGRPGLPGPLSQIVLKRDGTPHLVAVGVCYHAPGSITYRNVPKGSGNWYSIGIEGVSNGYNDWTEAQRREYPRVVAALLKDMGLPSNAWIFHRDYQPREKIDPGGFTKEWFQKEVDKWYHTNGTGNTAPAKSPIQIKREQSPWLGKAVREGEHPTPDGKGKFTFFENGAIYQKTGLGAFAISSEILEKYAVLGYEQSFLGYPNSDVFDLPNGRGRAQKFEGGSIYWSEEYGAKTVFGRIGSKFAEYGWEAGIFDMPMTDPTLLPDKSGQMQRFEGGHIYWTSLTDAHPIYGLVWDAFAANDYERGFGYPKTDESDTQDGNGRYQKFERGTAYWKKGTEKAIFVKSDIMKYYELLAYEVGQLGYVISPEEEVEPNVFVQKFEGGDIRINRVTGEAWLYIDGEDVVL